MSQIQGIAIIPDPMKAAPKLAPAPSVDLAMLTAGDPAPRYITREITPGGIVGSSSMLHQDNPLPSLVAQINASGPTGVSGYLRELDGNTPNTPDVYWIAAEMHGPAAWVKGYVVSGREKFLRAAEAGGKVVVVVRGGNPYEDVAELEDRDDSYYFRLSGLDYKPFTQVPALVCEMQTRSHQADRREPTPEDIEAARKETGI